MIEGRVKQVMMKSMSELEQQGNPMEEAAQEAETAVKAVTKYQIPSQTACSPRRASHSPH